MIVKVHMLAFCDKETTRDVTIPYEADERELEDVLDSTFKYGQNDFQPQNLPSVSVGDVVEYNGEYHDVKGIGFEKITPEEFEGLEGNRARNGVIF